jgi:hypothetical protein
MSKSSKSQRDRDRPYGRTHGSDRAPSGKFPTGRPTIEHRRIGVYESKETLPLGIAICDISMSPEPSIVEDMCQEIQGSRASKNWGLREKGNLAAWNCDTRYPDEP